MSEISSEMSQAFRVVDHTHITISGARFSPGTMLCTACVGRAFLMALFAPYQVITSEGVNTALDRLTTARSSNSGAGLQAAPPTAAVFGETAFE